MRCRFDTMEKYEIQCTPSREHFHDADGKMTYFTYNFTVIRDLNASTSASLEKQGLN